MKEIKNLLFLILLMLPCLSISQTTIQVTECKDEVVTYEKVIILCVKGEDGNLEQITGYIESKSKYPMSSLTHNELFTSPKGLFFDKNLKPIPDTYTVWFYKKPKP